MNFRVSAAAVLAVVGLGVTANSASAALIITPTAPTTDILASNPTGTINTRLIDEDASSNHARGQLFSLGDSAGDSFEIAAVVFRKNNDQTYDDDTLTLRIFQGTRAQWDLGTGHSTADDGNNYYVDTEVTPLYEEAYTMSGLIADDDYIIMELTNSLTVDENSDYGFFMVYDQGASSNNDITHYESQPGTDGDRLSITTTDHGASGARRVHYYVLGTVVPEPASIVLLSLSAFGLLGFRRR